MRHSLPPIRDRKIRFAIVGCGRIAKNHFDAIQSYTDNAKIVSVCDIDPEALDKAATQTQAKAQTQASTHTHAHTHTHEDTHTPTHR